MDENSAIYKTKKLLNNTGLPYRYLSFSEKSVPKMPYLTFQFLYSNNMAADGKVYYQISRVKIDLFTKIKDLDAEKQVEMALSGHYWEKEEEYLDNQDCYQITYEIEMEGS